jgi:glycosyltransferase involved in cell wall biosynthesis
MGLENLVESVTSLRAAIPDVLVMIAGSGPLAKTLEARITDAGVSDHVRLLGYVRDEHLPLAYRAADLSVVPSVALEGFGLIVAESLAAGTPVVVTSVGGLPETIEGLAPQCIVGDTRPAVLADVLAAALAGRLPLPSATACREHARQRFDWQVVAARVRDVYTEALS